MGLSPESKARGEKLVSGGKFVPRYVQVYFYKSLMLAKTGFKFYDKNLL
jgi:hypothetical protein